jgi:ribosomal-protein-alanine N-acetyltransferase
MIIPGNDPLQGANALPAAVHMRPMRLEDIDAVIQIDRLSFSLPWPASAFRYELVDNPTSLLWVAEVDTPEGGRCVVGAVVVWMILDEAHIATLAVHPDYRRQGISRRLLATVLRQAIERGADLATLEVRANNLAAQALYKQFRFEIVGRRPRYYQDNFEDALIMTVEFSRGTCAQSGYRDTLEKLHPEHQSPNPKEVQIES